MTRALLGLLLLTACSSPPVTSPSSPDPCVIARTAPGPSTAVIATLETSLAVARERVRDARLTGDPGFYTLADLAVQCGRFNKEPVDDLDWMQAHVAVQLHRFAQAEDIAHQLVVRRGAWDDHMLLSDALMEQGELVAAQEALAPALETHPSLHTYDRAAWLAWQQGHTDLARHLQQLAVALGHRNAPEQSAWALTQLGWLQAMSGDAPEALHAALALIPGYRPALLRRGMIRLHHDDRKGALLDLQVVGDTVAGRRALAELIPNTDVHEIGRQDARGYAIWLASSDPARAVELLTQELLDRQDAHTHLAHAFALHHLGEDARTEALAAVNTGIADPEALAMAAVVLSRPDLMQRARASGPGLLPSWRNWSL